MHHHAHGHRGGAAGALFEHGEQDALFFHHVAEQFALDGVQQGNHLGGELTCMHAGHFLGQWNELIELAAVGVVVARQDVVDDVAVGGVLPKFVINHECGVLYGSIVNENKNATVLARLAVLRILFVGRRLVPFSFYSAI